MVAQPRTNAIERRGRFRVERLIGRGGTAAVYEAVLDDLGRRFALKVLLSPGPTTVARLQREAKALGRLDHPNIVAPVDFGTEDGEPYLVMELVNGETLAARLARTGRFSLTEVAAIFLPVCSALRAAHELGIVHRDLKPSNIMIAPTLGGRSMPKVLDFGLARSLTATEATLTGETVLGTVGYLSPEAARGERDLTPQSDLYSLGVMLFECATGQRPFLGESAYDVMHAIVTTEAKAPRALVPHLPEGFDALVAKALARDRSARWAHAADLGRSLLPFADMPTRALWEPEFGASHGIDVAITQTELTRAFSERGPGTLTDHDLTAIRELRSPRDSRRWGRRVRQVAMPVGLALLVLLSWEWRLGPSPAYRSPAVTVPSNASSEPTVPAPSVQPDSAEVSAVVVAVVATASAAAGPSSARPPRPVRREPKHLAVVPVSDAPPAPSASATIESGANGALILE